MHGETGRDAVHFCARERFTKLTRQTSTVVSQYGIETWVTTRGQEARLEVNKMRMLRWMCAAKGGILSEMNTLEGQEWCKRPSPSLVISSRRAAVLVLS